MDIANKYSKSPYPAWAFSLGLATTPFLKPSIPNTAPKFSPYPANWQVAVFSAFVGLGGFMCYDNDINDGSTVIAVWSTLYTLSNYKRAIWNLKVGPKLLLGLSTINSVLYTGQAVKLYS